MLLARLGVVRAIEFARRRSYMYCNDTFRLQAVYMLFTCWRLATRACHSMLKCKLLNGCAKVSLVVSDCARQLRDIQVVD